VFLKNAGVFLIFFAFSRRKMLGVFRSVPAADLLSRGCLDVEIQPDEAIGVLDGGRKGGDLPFERYRGQGV